MGSVLAKSITNTNQTPLTPIGLQDLRNESSDVQLDQQKLSRIQERDNPGSMEELHKKCKGL